ncbi:MAG: hypothetical protein JKX84_00160 [Flavobacteriales bacterium]|nr:hypothetical protein [Flavobacteriales bacterium]
MRSGTTLLSRLLSAHPQIVQLGFELMDVWTEIGDAPCENTCEFRDASHFSEKSRKRMTDYFNSELRRWSPSFAKGRWRGKRLRG